MLLKQFPQRIPNKFAHQTTPQSLPVPTCGAPLRFEISTTLGCNFEIQEGDSTNSIIAARLPDLLQSKTQRPRKNESCAKLSVQKGAPGKIPGNFPNG